MAKENEPRQKVIRLQVNLRGVQPGDESPVVALYQLDLNGRPLKKIDAAEDGVLRLPDDLAKEVELIALGPNVEELGQLDRDSLQIYRAEEIMLQWKEAGRIDIPRLRWRPWWLHLVCLTGNVKKCWFGPPFLPPIAPVGPIARRVGLSPMPFRESVQFDLARSFLPLIKCAPLCNGLVEIYERVCCCDWWEIIPRIPELLPELIPIPFPDPDPGPLIPEIPPRLEPFPGPGPFPGPRPPTPPRVIRRQQKLYEAMVEPAARIPLDERVARDLNVLINLSDQQQIHEYLVARPYLLPVFCHCSSKKIGETNLNVDGSFSFCYFRGLYLANCSISYTYKVKQFIGGSWLTIYDGEAAHAYFSAAELAELTTFNTQAETCTPPEAPPVDGHGRPFIMLQAIATTDSHELHSPLQSSLTGVTGADNSGLLDQSYSPECPLGKTLQLLLWFDPVIESIGVKYYRFSLAQTDGNGDILPGTRQALTKSVSWRRWANGVWPPQPENIALGPVDPTTVNNEPGLIRIPYFSSTNRWLGNQYHYALDTTEFSNGRYALILEVFDAAGNRLRPTGATGAGTDANFHFIHWDTAVTTSVVDYAQLLHLLHFDNTKCFVDIVDLRQDGVVSVEECQFKTGTAASQFSVGYRAYQLNGYMLSYHLTYQRGLNGTGLNGTGTLASGTTNQPATMNVGPPAVSPSLSFGHMLGHGAHQKCTFTLELYAYAKHTNGDDRLSGYDAEDDASFALEISS